MENLQNVHVYEKTDFFAPKPPSFHSIFHFVECPHVKVYGLFQLWFAQGILLCCPLSTTLQMSDMMMRRFLLGFITQHVKPCYIYGGNFIHLKLTGSGY